MGGIGSGGHNKKSQQQHLLEGTYRPDRHGPIKKADNSPVSFKPPEWLNDEAKKLFRELSPKLQENGALDNLSLSAFWALCDCWGHMQDINKNLHGNMVVSVNGKIRENPLLRLYNNYSTQFLSLCREFGLTPASRERVGTDNRSIDEEDPLDKLLNTKRKN